MAKKTSGNLPDLSKLSKDEQLAFHAFLDNPKLLMNFPDHLKRFIQSHK